MTKDELKKLLKEHLEVSTTVWVTTDENGHTQAQVTTTVEFDGEEVATQDDSGW